VLILETARKDLQKHHVPAEPKHDRLREVDLWHVPHGTLITGEVSRTPLDMAETGQQHYLRVQQIAREYQPSILVCFFPSSNGLACALTAEELGIPLALGIRGNDIGKHIHDPLKLPKLQLCFGKARGATYVAGDLKRLAESVAGSPPISRVIHNGIPPEILERTWKPMNAGAARFGSVGVFSPKKALWLAAEALRQRPEWRSRTLLVGQFTQPLAPELAAGLEVSGLVDHDRAVEALDEMDVFLAPSYSDGCPNAVLEAMAAGRAILTTPVAAMRDLLVHETSAWFLDRWEVTDMIQAMDRLDRDPALRRRLGEGARQMASTLTVAREIENWESFLEQCVRA
jgi:glycosyltransferase involved in cell wall biosynthesis